MIKLFFTIIFVLFIYSCNESLTKTSYINNYESFIYNLSKNYLTFSKEDWEDVELEFYSYSEVEFKKFEDDLTEQEKKKIEKLTGKYYAIIAKYKFGEFNSEIKSVINTASGFIEELKK